MSKKNHFKLDSWEEHQRIMNDLEQSLKTAQAEGDVARQFYTQEAIIIMRSNITTL